MIRPNDKVDGNFVAYYSKGHTEQRKRLAKHAQGITIIHIYYNSISNEEIYLPSLDEQKKISGILMRIDSLLALHQRELEKLKNIKSALLEKMFI